MSILAPAGKPQPVGDAVHTPVHHALDVLSTVSLDAQRLARQLARDQLLTEAVQPAFAQIVARLHELADLVGDLERSDRADR